MDEQKKGYLAGPMRGIPEFNFPAFHAATAKLRAEGHIVFNPAEKDEEAHGKDLTKGTTGDLKEIPQFSLRDALKADLSWICDNANTIWLLPNWQNSKGAVAERALGVALGLEIIEL